MSNIWCKSMGAGGDERRDEGKGGGGSSRGVAPLAVCLGCFSRFTLVRGRYTRVDVGDLVLLDPSGRLPWGRPILGSRRSFESAQRPCSFRKIVTPRAYCDRKQQGKRTHSASAYRLKTHPAKPKHGSQHGLASRQRTKIRQNI